MAIWKAVPGASVEPTPGPSAVSIGAFEGVHRGHQQLLARARQAAGDGLTVAVTFDPHPAALFVKDRPPALLTTLERKVELLHAHGADEVRVLDFGTQMASWSPEEFVERVILDQCHATAVVVGENFRFGHRASGTVETLAELGAASGFESISFGLVGDEDSYSSTRIRSAVASGDLAGANRMLGRPLEVSGVVVTGDKRGRELGFPTANLLVDERYAVPLDGVYAGHLVRASGERLPAAISVGTNPTFEAVAGRRIESYVLDRTDLDLYGENVRVEFVEHLRGMVSFDGIDDLVAQIADDVARTRSIIIDGADARRVD